MGPKRQGTDRLPFGKILKQLMTERELTVRAVAEMAGVTASVAQSWISGGVPHDLQAVGKLAKALNISFKELLLGEREESVALGSLSDLFEEQSLFDGFCRVKIERLLPKKGK